MSSLLASPTLAALCGISLAALSGCNANGGGADSGSGTGQTSPSVTIAAAAAPSATQASFTVQRTGPTDAALTVSLTATDAAAAGDYAAPATVTIPAGDASAQAIVTRTADASFEGPRTITVTVAAGTGYVPGTAASAQGTMADLDLPQVAGTYSGSFTPVTGVAAGRGAGGTGLSVVGLVIVPSPSLFLAAAPVAWTVDLTQSGGSLSGYYVDDRGFSGPVTGTVDATGALALTVAVEGAPTGSSATGTIAIAATVQPDAGAVRGVIASSSPAITEAFSATSSSGTTAYAGEAPSTMAGAGTADGSPAKPSASSIIGFWNYDGNDADMSPRRYVYLNGSVQRLDAWDQPVAASATTVTGNQVVGWLDQGASYTPASQRYSRNTWVLASDGTAMDNTVREVSGDNVTWSSLTPYAGRMLRVTGGDPWFRLSVRSLVVDGSAAEWDGAMDYVNGDPSGDTMSAGNSSTDLRDLWMCVNYVSGNPSSLGLFIGLSGHPADAGTTDASSTFGSYRVDIIKRSGLNFNLFAGLGSIASNPNRSDPWPLSGNIKDSSGTVVANGAAQGVEVYSNGADGIEAGLPVTPLGIGRGSRFLVRVKTTSTTATGGLTYDRTRTILVTIPQTP